MSDRKRTVEKAGAAREKTVLQLGSNDADQVLSESDLVASIIRAKDDGDPVRLANDSRDGLGGGIFSRD